MGSSGEEHNQREESPRENEAEERDVKRVQATREVAMLPLRVADTNKTTNWDQQKKESWSQSVDSNEIPSSLVSKENVEGGSAESSREKKQKQEPLLHIYNKLVLSLEYSTSSISSS